MSVSAACFGHLTHLLVAASTLNHPREMGQSRGGVILALEGGYNLVATAESLSHCVAALLSDTCLRLTSGLAPSDKLVPLSSPPSLPPSIIRSKLCSFVFPFRTTCPTVPYRLCKCTGNSIRCLFSPSCICLFFFCLLDAFLNPSLLDFFSQECSYYPQGCGSS